MRLRRQYCPRGAVGAETLAHNVSLNLAGRCIPLVVGIGTMPFIIRGLGPDRFGILGIIWVLFNYLSLCDLGLGRATTKFLARVLAEGNRSQIRSLVWSSFLAQIALGLAGGALLVILVPLLIGPLLNIPAALQQETRLTLYLLALSLPVILANNGLRAVLEGCQRFDLANFLGTPASTLVFLIPALSLPFGLRLPAIVSLLLLSRSFFLAAHLAFCRKALPELKNSFGFRHHGVTSLLTYGGWVTIGNVVNGVLLYLDRFLIGSLLPVALVGYYTAPFEAVTKLWLFPSSLAAAIFPACSGLECDRAKLQSLYSRSLKYLVIVLGPITLIVVFFARDILTLWLGSEFASRSSLVLQILAIGVFVNCLSHIPYSYLHGLGRPNATAKLFLAQLPVYAILAWWMVREYGISGAAAAWSLRVGVEVLIMLAIVRKLFSFEPDLNKDVSLRRALAALVGLAVFFGITAWLSPTLWLKASLSLFWATLFSGVVWQFVLDDFDRSSVLSAARLLRPPYRFVGHPGSRTVPLNYRSGATRKV